MNLDKIEKANPELATIIAGNGGFLLDDQIDELMKIDRLMLVLVRCGCGRFLCPVQDLKHFCAIIAEHSEAKPFSVENDYVRDVSLPA